MLRCIFDSIFFSVILASCSTSDQRTVNLTATLGGKVTEVKGLSWPRYKDGSLHKCLSFENSCVVTLRFSEDRFFSTFTTSVFLSRIDDRIWEVSIVPTKEPLTFSEGIDLVYEITKALGADKHENTEQVLKKWKNMSPVEKSGFPLSLGVPFLDKFDARFELRYSEDYHGWLLAVDFTVPKLIKTE
jgi:hypothetical protein